MPGKIVFPRRRPAKGLFFIDAAAQRKYTL
jgi:hypothetical protein